MTTFEEILSRDGRLIYKTRGVSMQPMLYQNRDLVIIETLFIQCDLSNVIYPMCPFRIRLRSRLRKLLAKPGLLEPLKKVLRKTGLRK